jgi:hypothetical protein
MSAYQPTDDEKSYIRELEEFRRAIARWSETARPDEREPLRSQINRTRERVQEIVHLAGCHRTMTLYPPPIVGGLVMRGVDPFDYIFEDVYGQHLVDVVRDMLENTIGVIESGKFEERRSRIQRTRGADIWQQSVSCPWS